MKPIKFKEANSFLSGKEHQGLWIFTDTVQCVSCWKMTWKERLSALFFGSVWLGTLTGQSQPPVWLDCTRTVFEEAKQNENN